MPQSSEIAYLTSFCGEREGEGFKASVTGGHRRPQGSGDNREQRPSLSFLAGAGFVFDNLGLAISAILNQNTQIPAYFKSCWSPLSMAQDWEPDLPHMVPASAPENWSLVSGEGLTGSVQHTAYPLGTQETGCFLLSSYEPQPGQMWSTPGQRLPLLRETVWWMLGNAMGAVTVPEQTLPGHKTYNPRL